MKLSFSENIYRLRKSKHMTQEQLAEALGVTFASVSKWERGAATPELNLIAQMANIFEVSIDALVGFNLHSDSITAVEERIHDLQKGKNYIDAINEAEKVLLRYPNDFRIVYRAGELYSFAGMEGKEDRYLQRGIELLKHSISLLSQNDDPEINEVAIQSQIAQSYIRLGNTEAGLEILKQYNANGVFNDLIALIYTTDVRPFDPKKAEPYMMDAFAGIITSSLRTMMAYANYYRETGNLIASRDALLWLMDFLQSIKINPGTVAYVDKVIASFYAECAVLSYDIGEKKMTETYLRCSHQAAKVFDATPTYNIENIKFCVGDIREATVYDDLGKSAILSVEEQLADKSGDDELLKTWKQILKTDKEETYDEKK